MESARRILDGNVRGAITHGNEWRRKLMSSPRCTVNDAGQVAPCSPLKRAGEDFYRGKGLRYVRLTKLASGGFQDGQSFFALHSGEFKSKGVVINFCPFCGNNIGSHLKTQKHADTQAQDAGKHFVRDEVNG
jgi:hypothetical protein